MYFVSKLKLFGVNLRVTLFTKNGWDYTGGVASRLRDGNYIVMLDFDKHEKEWVVDEVHAIQNRAGLGVGYMFQSGERGFHVYLPDVMPFREAERIIYNSSCDYLFKVAPVSTNYKTWVLRNLRKGRREQPEYVGRILPDGDGRYVRSTAHLQFLERLGVDDVKLEGNKVQDGKGIDENLIFVYYDTGNRVK